jgi:hypothetical protein
MRDKFERTISNGIHWKDERNGLIDIEYYKSLNSAKNCSISCTVFSTVFIFWFIIRIILLIHSNIGFEDYLIYFLPFVIFWLSTNILGIKGCVGIKKRKPNSLFQLRVHAFLSITFLIFLAIIDVEVLASWLFLAWAAVTIIALVLLLSNKDLPTLYPKGYEKILPTDYVLAALSIISAISLIIVF